MSDNESFLTMKVFHRLWPIISPYKAGLFFASVALVLNAIGDTVMLSLLGPLIDKGFSSKYSNVLIEMPFILLALVILRGVTGYVSTYCLAWVSGKVVMIMRQRLFAHLMSLPVSFFDKESTGTLLSRITYDTEQVTQASSTALITIVREGVYIISLFVIMFYNSWQLSLILLLIAPFVSYVISRVSQRFREVSKNMQNTMGAVSTSAEQMLKGHKEVLVFGAQEVEINRFNRVSNIMRQQGIKMTAATAIADPIVQLISSCALAFVLYAISFPAIRESLTPGAFAVVFSSMFALMRPLKMLTNVNAQIQKGIAACQTLFELLDRPLEKDEGKIHLAHAIGDIEFKSVTFSYAHQHHHKPVLKDISFHLPVGKTVALVGRSGSGKSTIASLLTRFYDIDQGQILLDRHDLRDYTLQSLRQQIGLVSQYVHLFNDTIANNITYAYDKPYTREALIKVAEMAHVMSFVDRMENGLDTVIGENGVMLSGGQRQRIAIARALLRDNPILILDEATSALDVESEQAIQAALEELQKNRTVLVIAHRLSTIEKADTILVLDHGEIIERGNHAELMAKNGAYTQLHNMQFTLSDDA